MIKELLKYQKLDIELRKLQKELVSENTNVKIEQLTKIRKEKQKKLIELDEEASKNINSLTTITETTQKGLGSSAKTISTNLDEISSVEELEKLLQKCNKYIGNFDVISSKLKSVENTIDNTISNYKNTKQEALKAGKMIKDLNASVEQNKEGKKPEIETILKEMAELEKTIPEDKLKKYKELKENKVFPVITKLDDKSCHGCGMKLSEKNLEEISSQKYTICESCHRIVVDIKK